jgi:hypothetical protein
MEEQLHGPGAETAGIALVAQPDAAAIADRPLQPGRLLGAGQGAGHLGGEGAVGKGALGLVAAAGAAVAGAAAGW